MTFQQLMALACTCPAASEIGDITIPTCPEDIGQIQKVLFQRNFTAGVQNSITIASTNPNLLATWTALMALSTSEKVVPGPFFHNPVNEPGEKLEYGGGNETLNGIPIVVGRDPSPFDADFLRLPAETATELKTYECEDIGVYLIDQFGRIWSDSDDAGTPTIIYPIPVDSFFISDRRLGGFAEPDKNFMKWMFKPNWSDNLTATTPTDFNALTGLVAP